MGNEKFEKQYDIKTVNGVPKSAIISKNISTYHNEYVIKARDPDSKHIQSYAPIASTVDHQLAFFGRIQNDMLSEIFDTLDTLELSEKAYLAYFQNLNAMIEDSEATTKNPAYYVYHQTSLKLSEHLTWLESYIDTDLIPLKTIKNQADMHSVFLHRDKHDLLSSSCMSMFEETKSLIESYIGGGTDLIDQVNLANMRLEKAKIHASIYEILNKLSKNETISEQEYIYIKQHMTVDQVPHERADNERIIAIAKSMITIAPGFPLMSEQIKVALKNHVDELLTVFMSDITERIKTVSDEISHHNLNITKMVLVLNVYLKIFRDIVPKLSLASSNGKIRYCGYTYDADQIFSNKTLDQGYPAELQNIHNNYAAALLSLKNTTERFILKLVSETNSMVAAYELEPTQDLADQIMERIVGHNQCLSNYRLLFYIATGEGLSNFEIDNTLIPSSRVLLTTLITKIKDQSIPLIADYRVMHKMQELTRQIDRFGYLEAAHHRYFYDDTIKEHFFTNHAEIKEAAVKSHNRMMTQLALVKPFMFNITARNIFFFNDTFNELLSKRMNISKPSNAKLASDVINLILRNPEFKVSRVVFDDIARIISEKVPEAEHSALMHRLPCPDFEWQVDIESTTPQQYAEILLDPHYDWNSPTSNTQLERLLKYCLDDPSALSISDYEKVLSTLIDHKIWKPKLLQAYLQAVDRLNQPTQISNMRSLYQTLYKCLITDEAATLAEIAQSNTFIKQYPLAHILSLLESYKASDVSNDLATVKFIHEKMVEYVLGSPRIPVNNSLFMNHILILMNNRSITVDDPLNTQAPTIMNMKTKELAVFFNYICHYIHEFKAAYDFVEKLSVYIDHIVSYGISINLEQSERILAQVLALDSVSFKKIQKLSVRLVHILPDIPTGHGLNGQIEALFIKATQEKANMLADAMIDTDKINVLLSDNAIEAYQPDTQAALSAGANDVLSHFNRKVRPGKTLQRSVDMTERLSKQMKKLDTVMVMLDKAISLSNNTLINAVFADASSQISRIENRVSHFLGTQRNLPSSLCTAVDKLGKEDFSRDNIVLLKSQLLVHYDRLMAMMVDRLIEDLEVQLYSKDMQIAYLTIVINLMDKRQNHLCKSSENASGLIASAMANARTLSGRWQTSPCDTFLKNLTSTSLMYKNEYTSLITAISDRIVELGGSRPKLSTDPVAASSVVLSQKDPCRDFVL